MALKKQQKEETNNHASENKPVQNITKKTKPNLGKAVTTVETLIKDKKIKDSENKNFDKPSTIPVEQEP